MDALSLAMTERLSAIFSIDWRQLPETVAASTACRFSSRMALAIAACERWISRKESPKDCMVR